MQKKTPVLLIILFLLQVFACCIPAAAGEEENRTLKDARTLAAAKAFSRKGLIEQLEAMGHPHDQAEKAADELGADWNEMALRQAASFLSYMPLSEPKLTSRLIETGFTEEEIDYAVKNCGADWQENALKCARSYLELLTFTRSELMKQLQHDGFTYEVSFYAVSETLGIPQQSELEGMPNPYSISDEMRDYMSENIENIFPIQSLKDTYSSVIQPVYKDVGPNTAVQMRTREGQQTIRIYANPDGLHEYTFTDRVNSGNLRNFMFSMDVTIDDIYPSDQGGCFIGYTNESITAVKNREDTLVALAINPVISEFYTKTEGAEHGNHTQLPENGSSRSRLTIVRLTGLTFAYIDGKYAGQFYDNNEGPFQLVFGSLLYNKGDSAVCSFDNLAVRKVNQ